MIQPPSAATIDRIATVAMERMAAFATRATPYETFSAADIAAAVCADPTGDTARFLAGVIAKSIELVAALDFVEAR